MTISREADAYLDWTRAWTREVARVLKPDGSFWLAIGDEFAAELKMIVHRELGLSPRSWVIWYYTFGVNCKYKFSRSHAHLLYFVKDPTDFTFNLDADPRPLGPPAHLCRHPGQPPVGRLPDDTWILRPQDVPDGFSARGRYLVRPSRLRNVQGTSGLARLPDARATARPDHPGQLESLATLCSTLLPAAAPR